MASPISDEIKRHLHFAQRLHRKRLK